MDEHVAATDAAEEDAVGGKVKKAHIAPRGAT